MQIFEQQNAVKMHFFDYSLWNHYVNVRLPPFMPETRPSLLSFYLIFALHFLHFCTFILSPLSDLGSIHGCSMVFPCFSHGLCPARSPPLQPVPFFTHSLPVQLPTWPLFSWSFFSCLSGKVANFHVSVSFPSLYTLPQLCHFVTLSFSFASHSYLVLRTRTIISHP